jgi:hypothetical protein
VGIKHGTFRFFAEAIGNLFLAKSYAVESPRQQFKQLVAGFGRHEVANTLDGERRAAVALVDAA